MTRSEVGMTCYEAKQHNINPWILIVPHTHTNAGAQEEAGSKGQQANQHLPAQSSTTHHHAMCMLMPGWLAGQLVKMCPRHINTAAGMVCSAVSQELQPGGAALYCALSHMIHGQHAKTAHELRHACHDTAWLQVSQLTCKTLKTVLLQYALDT